MRHITKLQLRNYQVEEAVLDLTAAMRVIGFHAFSPGTNDAYVWVDADDQDPSVTWHLKAFSADHYDPIPPDAVYCASFLAVDQLWFLYAWKEK